MPKVPTTRLTLVVVGVLLCSLPVTGAELLPRMGPPAVTGQTSTGLQLVANQCPGFRGKHVLRGKKPRRGRTCRPLGIDGGIVRAPIAKAKKRDRHNFGRRVHGKRHTGTDFRARCGTVVRASHAGKVVLPRNRSGGPRTVGVSTGPRRLTTWYGHLRKVRVRNGAMVTARRPLGRVAKVRGSRCHLHFSVYLRAGAGDQARANASRWLRKHKGTHVAGMAPPVRRRGVFVAATLNVLGHSHTARGGDKRRRFAGSARRMKWSVSLLRSNNVSLVGLQELQRQQRRQFFRNTRGWRMFSPRRDPQDSIAWRASRFRLLDTSIVKVPYFRRKRPMPIVKLRDRATGRKLVVVSVHNPASRGRGKSMKKRRNAAVRRELKVVRKIRRGGPPVILMGDFNDKSRKFYCKVRRHGLHASSRGVAGRRCRPNQVAGIDWILGTRKIRFQAHQRVAGGLVGRTTDHPLVLTRVRR